MPISAARRVAFDILRLVEGGGYASELLRARAEGLKSRDAGLASELVFGTIRRQAQLDFLIEHFSGRRAEGLDREVRLALRLGIYQLRHLDRIPRHAAVTESVELVKRAHKRSAAGLVNAVLRKVNREPAVWPDRATELSQPAWLLESWERQFGAETARAIAQAFLAPPKTYIRIPAGREAEAEGLELEETEVPGCYVLRSGEAPGWRQQDISSQAVAGLLELAAGMSFLDVCAAPGNKTAQALEWGVRAVACDSHYGRLRGMAGLGAELVQADGTAPLPFRRGFERILVDAPCSGTGTIGRNPEIKWRLRPQDLERHQARQKKLLASAVEVLALGGRLVYSTCSLEREENEAVVEAVLAGCGGEVRLERMVRRIPGVDAGDGFFAAVMVRGYTGRVN